MRGEVLGRVERRRRWSIRDKLAVVVASLEHGAVVSDVARRFDVTRQQVYDWRRAARRGDLGMQGGVVGFVEVVPEPALMMPSVEDAPDAMGVAPDSAPAAAEATAAPDMTVEIVLAGGRVLRTPASLPTAELRRLIGAVEGA
ncbi:IS66-like element accessory protein TnpA [Rubrimonas sp.]|uniref:IS66-like element accessory protein TnpA n=1 Tax=Rubrimonas sp. TaxID=2036015 RepID=UPI002FDD0BEB